jgi:hypothetical protein
MKANALPFKPLLAALALVLATTACQQRDDTMATPAATPTNDAATVPAQPADTMAPPPPMQEVDPCAGLMGTELDECLRRQTETNTPPIIDNQTPPPDATPMNEPAPTTPPTN